MLEQSIEKEAREMKDISMKDRLFNGGRHRIPPNNLPPYGRKCFGFHESPNCENPMYVRIDENHLKRVEEPAIKTEQGCETVQSWGHLGYPKMRTERINQCAIAIPSKMRASPEGVSSQPTFNVFLAVTFALGVYLGKN